MRNGFLYNILDGLKPNVWGIWFLGMLAVLSYWVLKTIQAIHFPFHCQAQLRRLIQEWLWMWEELLGPLRFLALSSTVYWNKSGSFWLASLGSIEDTYFHVDSFLCRIYPGSVQPLGFHGFSDQGDRPFTRVVEPLERCQSPVIYLADPSRLWTQLLACLLAHFLL